MKSYKLALFVFSIVAMLVLARAVPAHAQEIPLDEETITEAYIYLLGRVLVNRQEQLDIGEQGMRYNVVHHNPLGDVDFVNPNMSVTNSQLWIAVDDETPVVLEIPKIDDRFYTAQIVDEWGEVITNINPRNFPLQAHGKFAFVAPGYTGKIPDDAVRIELRSYKAKMLARVELQHSPDVAVGLQQQIRSRSLGKPDFPSAVEIPNFDNQSLIGVEIFEHADAILTSAIDVSPKAVQMQAKVRAVAREVKDATSRDAIDKLLREQVIPAFRQFSVTESGATNNNWLGTLVVGNYGDDYAIRTAANLVGIWAQSRHEVIYHITTRDGDGVQLNGSNQYVMYFPKDALPQDVVNEFWSVHLVSLPDFRPVPNPLDRYVLSTWSNVQKEPDGSLKLVIAPQAPESVPDSNWLPSPVGQPFSLTFRSYVPKPIVQSGDWFPPVVESIE